ncbi:ABC transporter ATP-binding protein [Lichenifustis flavocetrariae]|uniref:ABC transporter ATP-binding protein n=1 Tax=Lichenifustis flavocetrariae TaxID=2949735 RepID=A0AA42CHE9_9HYPH|nr:ABC transporter ATP-binding protein [Lichenifustis flavocetrariae]MCW6507204.1 ABC transporter ATP-binding protein [Lichenifustis flavocetrariae]
MNQSLLRVESLAKSYHGVPAVRGVSFTLERGEILALIGPNGAGKSTCFNMLNGQIRPNAGTILFEGQDVTASSPRSMWRRGVGRTFQITATFTSMTVRENLQTALLSHAGQLSRPFGKANRAFEVEADALLDRVGLRGQADRSCGELAYGDLKRLELAVALTNSPSLLLMDEPTAGMAPKERADLMRATAAIARERNVGILFTEHDMDIVFEHADRVMVLNRGELIAMGAPDVVRQDRQVRAIYLGEGLVHGDLAAAQVRH